MSLGNTLLVSLIACPGWKELHPPQDELSGGGFAKGLVWLETVFLHVCVCVAPVYCSAELHFEN